MALISMQITELATIVDVQNSSPKTIHHCHNWSYYSRREKCCCNRVAKPGKQFGSLVFDQLVHDMPMSYVT